VKRPRNPVQRAKIVGSKWTATRPSNRERHFMVQDWVRDEDGHPTDEVELEAVVTGRVRTIHWKDLEATDHWQIGWR
jgi:tryptophan-rich hypothetical protein